MQTLRNTLLIAATELSRTLVTRRGLISLGAFALLWSLILVTIIRKAPALVNSSTSIGSMIGSDTIVSLARWRVEEFGVHWFIALYVFPICCVIFASDQTASDKSRGTLKLLTLHTSRTSLFCGRFIGLMIVQSIVIALTLLSTLIIAAVREPALITDSLANAGFIWVNLMIVIAPYTALMAVISLLAKSGTQAISYAVYLWVFLLFAVYMLSKYFPEATLLKAIFPGSQIGDLVALYNWSSLSTIFIPAIQTLVFLACGLLVMHRIDL